MFAIAGAFFFFITAATFTSMGVVLPYMLEEFSWTRTQAGAGFSLLALMVGLAGPLPAWTMQRFGVKATYAGGAAIMAGGFALLALADGLHDYWAGAALLGLGFALCATVPGIRLINDWLPGRRSAAIGLYMTIGGLGAVAGPPGAALIITAADSWRAHWWLMCAAVLVLLLAAAGFVHGRPADATDDEADAAPEKTSKRVYKTTSDWRFRDAVRAPQYYVIVAALTLTLFCTLTMNNWAFIHLGALGASTAAAATALSINGAVNAVSRALGGLVATRVDPKWLLAAALTAEMIGMLALSVADNPVAIAVFALGEGLGFGLCFLAATLLLLNYFGVRDNPKILGTMNFLTTAAMAGPLAAGYLGDRLGSFAAAFQVNAALLLMLAVLVAVMRPPRPPQ